VVGDIFDDQSLWRAGRRYRLVLLGVRRLGEVDPEVARALLRRIAEHAAQLLLYSYDQVSVGEMTAVLERFGLEPSGGPAAAAVLVHCHR
jgi:hypothetical protein